MGPTIRILLTALICSAGISLLTAQSLPKGYFRSPVDYPISLSGTFGEIRRNHFHSGIDIRTGGVEGKPVYAIADGYVSRVFVSPSGFGKALYIVHPNGYTSVYGHLKSFSGAIGKWVREQQYKKESFSLDTEVTAGLLRVKKGEVIAMSGNSGSSGGPHLHFEIRETKSQEVLDPLAFGIPHKDSKPPQITWIRIYPQPPGGMVNFSDQPVLLPVTGSDGRYSLKIPDTVKVTGNIVFGIEAYDYNESSNLKSGIRSVVLNVDGQTVYAHTINRFAFSETRYVNALLDYPAFIKNQRKIQRSYVAPNNHLNIYDEVIERGVVHFSSKGLHKISYQVSDLNGNRSTLTFFVESHPPAPVGGRPEQGSVATGTLMTWKEDNLFQQADFKLKVPGEALYEELYFNYKSDPPVNGYYARIHNVHNKYTPLHTWCDLWIKPVNLPEKLKEKAVIVYLDDNGKYSSRGGSWENGMLKIRIRELGNYSIRVDTLPPVIKPVNIFSGKNLSKQSTVQIRISEDLSGIRTYRGTLNGEWILMDFDEKKGLLVYSFDHRLKPGKNQFLLVVTDAVGNKSSYQAVLVK